MPEYEKFSINSIQNPQIKYFVQCQRLQRMHLLVGKRLRMLVFGDISQNIQSATDSLCTYYKYYV